jgi:serine/threonine-protein kinase HipA
MPVEQAAFLIMDDDHLRLAECCLSPLYDVVPRATFSSERFLHLGVGPNGRLASLDNAYGAKERFGLLPDDALRIIDRVWSAVREWKPCFEQVGVSIDQIERIGSAFRHIDEIASSDLRKKL